MQKTNYINSFNAFRGVGALLVLIGHSESNFHIIKMLSLCERKLYLLVDLFFILSGFVIMLGFNRHFSEEISLSSYKKFLTNRFLRIYPLHIATLTGLLLMVCVYYILLEHKVNYAGAKTFMLNLDISFRSFASNILLMQAWHINDRLSWNYPAWSISGEFVAYLFFPLLCYFFFNLNTRLTLVFIGLCMAVYGALLYLVPGGDKLDLTYNYGVPRCMAGFCFGMLLCKLYISLPSLKSFFGGDTIMAMVLSGIVGLAAFKANDLLILPLLGLLLLCTAHNEGFFHRLFNKRPLQYLGNISYSIYLTHAIFLMAVSASCKLLLGKALTDLSLAENTMVLVASILSVILISGISYHFIEVKSPEYIRQFAKTFASYIRSMQENRLPVLFVRDLWEPSENVVWLDNFKAKLAGAKSFSPSLQEFKELSGKTVQD